MGGARPNTTSTLPSICSVTPVYAKEVIYPGQLTVALLTNHPQFFLLPPRFSCDRRPPPPPAMTTLDPAVPPTTSGDVATFSRLRHSYARGPAGQPVERVLSKDDPETGPARSHPLSAHKGGFKATVSLAFIGLGVIYGDLGTSPLYAMNGIFPASGPVPSEEDIIGGVSA